MNSVLEHKVNEVGGRLDEVVELLQVFQLSTLLLIEYIEVVFRGIQFHILELGS